MGTYVVIGPQTHEPPKLFCLDHTWTSQRCACTQPIPQLRVNDAPLIVTVIGKEAVMGRYNFRVLSTPFLTRLLQETGLATDLSLAHDDAQPITADILTALTMTHSLFERITTSYPQADKDILGWLLWWAQHAYDTYGDAAAFVFEDIGVSRTKAVSA